MEEEEGSGGGGGLPEELGITGGPRAFRDQIHFLLTPLLPECRCCVTRQPSGPASMFSHCDGMNPCGILNQTKPESLLSFALVMVFSLSQGRAEIKRFSFYSAVYFELGLRPDKATVHVF